MLTVQQSPTFSSLEGPILRSAVTSPVTFTVDVRSSSPGSIPLTGIVAFYDQAQMIGTAPVVNGIATLTTSALAKGNYMVHAVYQGDSNYEQSSTGTITQMVMRTAPAAAVKHATPVRTHPRRRPPSPRRRPPSPRLRRRSPRHIRSSSPKRIQRPSCGRPFPSRRMSNRQWSGRNGRDDVPEPLTTARHRHLAQPVVRHGSIPGSSRVTRAGWLGSSWRQPASPQRASLGSGGVALRASTPGTPEL